MYDYRAGRSIVLVPMNSQLNYGSASLYVKVYTVVTFYSPQNMAFQLDFPIQDFQRNCICISLVMASLPLSMTSTVFSLKVFLLNQM